MHSTLCVVYSVYWLALALCDIAYCIEMSMYFVRYACVCVWICFSLPLSLSLSTGHMPHIDCVTLLTVYFHKTLAAVTVQEAICRCCENQLISVDFSVRAVTASAFGCVCVCMDLSMGMFGVWVFE